MCPHRASCGSASVLRPPQGRTLWVTVRAMSTFDDVCSAVEAAMAETDTPGAAVGVLQNGDEQVRRFGITSVGNPLEVTPDTLFQIGSITKTFTGTAAMRLVERGALDLDAPVRTYLPALEL